MATQWNQEEDLSFRRFNGRGESLPISVDQYTPPLKTEDTQSTALPSVDRSPGHHEQSPAGDSTDQEAASPPARKRIAVACVRCRKRKIRCSGDPGNGESCDNCRNSGHQNCQFLRVQSYSYSIKDMVHELPVEPSGTRALRDRANPYPLSSTAPTQTPLTSLATAAQYRPSLPTDVPHGNRCLQVSYTTEYSEECGVAYPLLPHDNSRWTMGSEAGPMRRSSERIFRTFPTTRQPNGQISYFTDAVEVGAAKTLPSSRSATPNNLRVSYSQPKVSSTVVPNVQNPHDMFSAPAANIFTGDTRINAYQYGPSTAPGNPLPRREGLALSGMLTSGHIYVPHQSQVTSILRAGSPTPVEEVDEKSVPVRGVDELRVA